MLITPSVESALRSVYARIPNQRTNYFETELAERILNELVSNGHRTQSGNWQVRNARRNASKVLKARAMACPPANEAATATVIDGDDPVACFELMEWLRTTDVLCHEDRVILTGLAADVSIQSLARQLGISVGALNIKISRIRRVAWPAWLSDSQ